MEEIMENINRSKFLAAIQDAYNHRRKNVMLLTGGVNDLFWSEQAKDFFPVELAMHRELGEKFNVVRLDMSTGISFFDPETEQEIAEVWEFASNLDAFSKPRAERQSSGLKRIIAENKYNPLPNLVLLNTLAEAVQKTRSVKSNIQTEEVSEEKFKPLCIILQYAGALFPEGDFSRLSELDR